MRAPTNRLRMFRSREANSSAKRPALKSFPRGAHEGTSIRHVDIVVVAAAVPGVQRSPLEAKSAIRSPIIVSHRARRSRNHRVFVKAEVMQARMRLFWSLVCKMKPPNISEN